MARPKHPNKEIEAALIHAEAHGWTIELVPGHPWGQMKCPHNSPTCWSGRDCIKSIWSTPRNPQGHAKQLKKIVDKCMFLGDDDD